MEKEINKTAEESEPKNHYALDSTVQAARKFYQDHKSIPFKDYRTEMLKLPSYKVFDYLSHINDDCIWGWKQELMKVEQQSKDTEAAITSWLQSGKIEPAQTKFTEGPVRNIGREIEFFIHKKTTEQNEEIIRLRDFLKDCSTNLKMFNNNDLTDFEKKLLEKLESL